MSGLFGSIFSRLGNFLGNYIPFWSKEEDSQESYKSLLSLSHDSPVGPRNIYIGVGLTNASPS